MKKFKFFSMILITIASAFIFTACSCKKTVDPVSIYVTPLTRTMFISAEDYIVRYDILPQNATDVSVHIVSKNTAVATVDATNLRTTSGQFTVSAVGIGEAVIEVSINGTAIKATHKVTVLPDPVKLPTPENISFNTADDSIEFDAIAGIDEYQIKAVSENGEQIIAFTRKASEAGKTKLSKKIFGPDGVLNNQTEYELSVAAVGNGQQNLNSDFSDAVTAIKLLAPQNLTTTNGVINWEHNSLFEDGAVAYIVTVNGVDNRVTENQFSLQISDAIDYVVRVRAVRRTEEFVTISNSELSATVTVSKLVTPQLLLRNDFKESELFTDGMLTWPAVDKAIGYRIEFTSDGLDTFTIERTAVQDRAIFVDDRFEIGREYKATILAYGNNSTVLSSETSYVNFVKLQNPTNARVEDNVLFFTPVTGVSAELKYQVVVVAGQQSYALTTNNGQIELGNISSAVGNYDLYIRTLVTNQSTSVLYANSNIGQKQLQFEKLKSPQVLRVESDSTAVWENLTGAVAYDVYFGSSLSPVRRVNASDFSGQPTASFKLNSVVHIPVGQNKVSVVAIGGNQYVSSSVNGKTDFSFVKLDAPKNFKVNNLTNQISWASSPGALEYFVKENQGEFVTNAQSTAYSFVNLLPTGNRLYVYAKGNTNATPNTIDSEVVLFEAERIANTTGIKIINGLLTFAANENHVYDIFVNGIKVVTLENQNTYAFENNLTIGSSEPVSIVARPKENSADKNKLSSLPILFELFKLNAVDSLSITSQRVVNENAVFEFSWDAVLHATKYIVTIENIKNSTTHSYTVDVPSIVIADETANNKIVNEGNYNVTIVAVGSQNLVLTEGVMGYVNSNVTEPKQFEKLQSPTNLKVENGVVSFSDLNANEKVENYEIRFEKGQVGTPEYVTWTVITNQKSYKIVAPADVSVDLEGEYAVSVRAIGNGFNITSNYSVTRQIVQLNKVVKLAISQGQLIWEDYNQTYPDQSLAIEYAVYAENITDGDTDLVLLQDNIENPRLVLTNKLEVGKQYIIYVVAKSPGYITSHYSAGLTVEKLEQVSGLAINLNNGTKNYELSWNLLQDGGINKATHYNVYLIRDGQESLYVTVAGNQNVIVFDEFSDLPAGKYQLSVEPVGGKIDTKNYVTGIKTDVINISKLTQVTNVIVLNGIVSWTLSYEETDVLNIPTKYLVEVYQITEIGQDEQLLLIQTRELDTNATTFDLNGLAQGRYEVVITSVGNSTNKISSTPLPIRVEKINAEAINFRVLAGQLTWTHYDAANVRYDVYLKLQSDSTFEKIDSVTTNYYNFAPSALAEGNVYEVSVKIVANNLIASDFSPILQIEKLSKVQNFKSNKNIDTALPHYFSWNAVLNSNGYKIVPTVTQLEFDGAVLPGVLTKDIELNVAGTYSFRIQAVGSTGNSITDVLYISSDFSETQTVVVLDNVKNLRVENNLLKYNPSHMYTDATNSPDEYHIFVYTINDGSKQLAFKKLNATNLTWNFTNLLGEKLGAGTYYVEVISVSNSDNKVNSQPAMLESVIVLQAPQNVSTTKGYVYFALSEHDDENVKYEVYINSVLIGVINDNSAESTRIINSALTDSDSVELKLRAVSDNKIYSEYSEVVTISKLPTVTDLVVVTANNNSVLQWTDIPNATAYYIKFSPMVDELLDVAGFNESEGCIEFAGDGATGFILPSNLPAGQFSISVCAVGSTLNADYAGVHFLTSNYSATKNVTYLSEPTNIRMDRGVIKWNAVAGAAEYILEFYRINDADGQLEFVNTKRQQAVTFDAEKDSLLTNGKYVVYIKAVGNGTTHIMGGSFGEFEFNVANTLEGFKILNGYLRWTLSLDTIKRHVFGTASGPAFIGEDLTLLSNVFLGKTQDVNPLLVANLYPLFNIELKLNNDIFTITPTTVRYENNAFVFSYNVNRPAGNYGIVARYIGNSSGTQNGPGKNLSMFDDENELQMVYFSYGTKTKQINAYKLEAPITPVTHQTTSVSENAIRFNKIQSPTNASFIQYYFVIVTPKSGGNIITHLVDTHNLSEHDISNSVAKVYIKTLRDMSTGGALSEGINYNIIVVARGTIDSDLVGEGEDLFLTSNHTTTSEIIILPKPQPFTVASSDDSGENGIISFAQSYSAVNHILKIWNNGSDFRGANYHDLANGVVSVEIDINLAMANSDPYLTLRNGTYYYRVEDNPNILPSRNNTSYFASIEAIGNGITTISSDSDHKIKFIKWPSVELEGGGYTKPIVVENGSFKWTHVRIAEETSGTIVYATEYQIFVTKENNVTGDVQVYSINYRVPGNYYENYIVFNLPDEDIFNAVNADGSKNLYTVSVKVIGGKIGASEHSAGFNFVNSDTVHRADKSYRLEEVDNLKVTSGIVNWSQVNHASGYRIITGRSSVTEEIGIGNTIEYVLGNTYLPGVYTFAVKAISSSEAYLNSRVSDNIKLLKLDQPNLRVESGQIAWNNNDLNSSESDYSILRIAVPNDFDIEALTIFNGLEYKLLSADDKLVPGYEFDSALKAYEIIVPSAHAANTYKGLDLKGSPKGNYYLSVKYIGSSQEFVQPNGNYYTVSSTFVYMEFIKTEAPEIIIESVDTGDQTLTNIIKWSAISGATNYAVLVSKLDSSGAVIYSVPFERNSAKYNQFFTTQAGTVSFDLRAVSLYDEEVRQDPAFGNEYFVCVEAYGDNINHELRVAGYFKSNYSNTKAVTIPVLASNVNLTTYGLLTWTNFSEYTTQDIELTYLYGGQYITEVIYLPAGVNRYNLEMISESYSIRINTKSTSAQSGYTDAITGAFRIYASGDGSEQLPYVIANASQLYNIGYYPHKHFVLAQNINIASSDLYKDDWTPIGNRNDTANILLSEFTGTLNGNGYTIQNLRFTNTLVPSSIGTLGLFRQIGKTGVVQNLTVHVIAQNIDVINFGVITANNYGTIRKVITTGTVSNVQNIRFVYLAGVAHTNHIGALIEEVENQVNIAGGTSSITNTTGVAGIAYINRGTVSKVSNIGTLSGTTVGGIVHTNNGLVSTASNTGKIIATIGIDYLELTVAVGGLVAINDTGQIEYSYVHAMSENNIKVINNSQYGISVYVGGLIGLNGTGTVANSYVVMHKIDNDLYHVTSVGAIAGSSNGGHFGNVHYETYSNLVAYNGSAVTSNVTNKSDVDIKSPIFVDTLGSAVFENLSNYPTHKWRNGFSIIPL